MSSQIENEVEKKKAEKLQLEETIALTENMISQKYEELESLSRDKAKLIEVLYKIYNFNKRIF